MVNLRLSVVVVVVVDDGVTAACDCLLI